MAEKMKQCCGWSWLKVKQERQDLRHFVRRKASKTPREFTEAELKELRELSDRVRSAREAYEAHLADESLEHR